MKMNRKVLFALLAGALFCGSAVAQEEGFDLSSQRSEKQDVLPVEGSKIDHKGLIINPTPHVLTRGEGTLSLAEGVRMKDRKGCFAEDVPFLKLTPKGVALTLDFGAKLSAKAGVKPVSGAYRLEIGRKGISIVGYDEKGAYYGLQTLRQIVESPVSVAGELPQLTIQDWPDLPCRGVVEGFYGAPWSHEVRLSLIDFYGRFKMNAYLYGPKDDPYHSCPNWRKPYPEREAQQIKELVDACRRNRVDFVWAIHPGQDIQWNEEDYVNLVNKFELMYDLGVRAFAIFFDDISGEGTNPVRQTELLNRLNREFVAKKGDVAHLIVCPTDYSKLWANPTEEGSLAIYGKTLDESVSVFWTGDVVCSDLTPETMDWVNTRIRRPALYWWNYPVTDYARHILMQGPVYGLDTSLTEQDLCGLVSNPMEHGEASKLALYGVADYSWHVAAYNPIDSWERGIAFLTPEAREAYRTFAIHSCDTETGYRRDESWETEIFRVADYTQEQFDALRAELERVVAAPATLEKECKNQILLGELRPWLVEFRKLGERGLRTLDLIKLYEQGNGPAFWEAYTANLLSTEERDAYEAHKSGTMKLQAFYENAMDDLLYDFYTRLTGVIPTSCRTIGSFKTLSTVQGKLMLDRDLDTHYTSSASQGEGDWIGVDLGCVRPVSEIEIIQGRNSVDDVDYFDHARLQYSADGKTWTPLIEEMVKQYDIHWKGEPVEARYISLQRLPSEKSNWAAVREFKVNPMRPERLNFTVEAENLEQALYIFDGHPGTSYMNKGTLRFGVAEGTKGYTLLMKLGGAATVRQLAADGTVLAEMPLTASLTELSLVEGAARVEIEGSVELFEAVIR